MNPHCAALRDVLACGCQYAQLRAILGFNHIIPVATEKDLPHHRRGHDVFALSLRRRNCDVVWADRNRSRRAGLDLLARTTKRGAGEIDARGVEPLALDDIARPDKSSHELRTRPVVNILWRTGLLDLAGIHY